MHVNGTSVVRLAVSGKKLTTRYWKLVHKFNELCVSTLPVCSLCVCVIWYQHLHGKENSLEASKFDNFLLYRFLAKTPWEEFLMYEYIMNC